MTGWEYAFWGFFGGFAVDGLEFAGAIRRVGGWPWRQPGEPGLLPYAVSVAIRLVVGAGLAAAAGTTGQISGPFGALAVGVAAPLLIEQLARQIPLTTSTPSLPPPPSDQSASTMSSQPGPNASTGTIGTRTHDAGDEDEKG
jgi:hypothetical protein